IAGAAGTAVAGEAGSSLRAEIRNPADRRDVVGSVRYASEREIDAALAAAAQGAVEWGRTAADERATRLERAADLYEQQACEQAALAVREAGKTLADALAEVREAVDSLRYYGAQARAQLTERHAPLG